MGKKRYAYIFYSLILSFLFAILFSNRLLALTLTYDYQTNGGNSVTKEANEYNENDEVDLKVSAIKDNWTFLGWSTDQNSTTPLINFDMPNVDTTLYALYRYEEITYTASFNPGYASVNEINKTCTIPAKYNNENIETTCQIKTPTIIPIENFEIVGFGTDKDDSSTKIVDSDSLFTISSDTNLEAIIKRTFTIDFIKNKAQSITTSTTGNICEVNSLDDSCVIQSYGINAKTGYTIAGWNINEDDTSSNWSVLTERTFYGSMSSNYDSVYYAITPTIPYTIEYQFNTASLINNNYDKSYNIESIISLPKVAKYGYELVGWKPTVSVGNWNINDTYLNTVPAGKYGIITLEAVLNPIDVKINFDYQDGSGNEENRVVKFETKLGSLPIPTRPGFTFDGWYLQDDYLHGVDGEDILHWTDKETTIYAKWNINPITLNSISNIKKTYDGEFSQIEVEASHGSGLSLTYKWYKYNEKTDENEFTTISNNSILSIKDVKDNGKYIVVVSLSIDGQTVKEESNVCEVEITPKKVRILGLQVHDRIEDGTTKATISGGILDGVLADDSVDFSLIENVILSDSKVGSYQINPSATLVGPDSLNYQLEIIEPLTFNIRKISVESENGLVSIKALEGFNINYELWFSDNTNHIDLYDIKDVFGKDYKVRKLYQLKVLDDGTEVKYENVTIKVKLSKQLTKASKYKILVIGDENIVKECKYKDGYLTFEASSSVQFAIFSDDYKEYCLINILVVLLFSLMLACLCMFIKKTKIFRKKEKNKNQKQENIEVKEEKKISINDKYLKLDEERKEANRKKRLAEAIEKKKTTTKK